MIQRPRGTQDVLTPEVERWQEVEATARDLCRLYAFSEIRTPVIESTELFRRGGGESSDIVQKEMYTFTDRGGRSLTLRPESTAAVVRAYHEGRMEGLQKLFYIHAHFRYEKPQKGRFREHHQLGLEVLGSPSPMADAELIAFLFDFLGRTGLTGVQVALNSIGCPVCRPAYREALVAHYAPHREALCADCRARLEVNPLRLLDCKVPGCQPFKETAPKSTDHLCEACREHFDGLLEALRALGLDHTLDPTIVRGLDYYDRTVFEISHTSLGAQSAVCGGGRYDGLSEALGGPPLPCVGFGLGLERLVMTLDQIGQPVRETTGDLYLAVTDPGLGPLALREAGRLRTEGLAVEVDLTARSLKAQLRRAARLHYPMVGILGPEEASAGEITLRSMDEGTQARVTLDALTSRIGGA